VENWLIKRSFFSESVVIGGGKKIKNYLDWQQLKKPGFHVWKTGPAAPEPGSGV